MTYQQSQKDAENRGYSRGRAEGRAEGKVEGKAEGKVEGKAEGKVEGFLAAIVGLVKDGLLPLSEACKRTKLPEKDFMALLSATKQ